MTEEERGAAVSRTVWEWLCAERQIKYVPWVLDPRNDKYDPIKAAKQEEHDEMLDALERVIRNKCKELDAAQP